MIAGILTSRGRVAIWSGLSMVATDLANAKLSSMLANAKRASIHATKVIATKVIAKATALWMLIMSVMVPIQQTPAVVHMPAALHQRHPKVAVAAPVNEQVPEKVLYLHTFEKEFTIVF